MPKIKTNSRKTKSCNRGYPCGGSCISRGFNCRKKLEGQANNYANWLKFQGESLGDDFNKEVGKRLGLEAELLGRERRAGNPLANFVGSMGSLFEESDRVMLQSDKTFLDLAQQGLEKSQKTIKSIKGKLSRDKKKIPSAINSRIKKALEESVLGYQKKLDIETKLLADIKKEIAELSKSVAERQKKIDIADRRLPKNQIQSFQRLSEFTKEVIKRNKGKLPPAVENTTREIQNALNRLEGYKDKVVKANQIVPFRKKNRDFAEQGGLDEGDGFRPWPLRSIDDRFESSPFEKYKAEKNRLVKLIQILSELLQNLS